MNTLRKCDFCSGEEGKPRPLGRFVVELTPVTTVSEEKKYACQSCIVHYRDQFKNENEENGRFLKKIKERLVSLTS